MIYGIGVDMVSISRIEKACKKEAFLKHVFSCKEIELYRDNTSKLAANFAAKESFSKALGTGVRGFEMKEVELFRDEIGKPYYSFSGKAKEIVTANNLKSFASVTDEEDTVVVFTVLEII
ncbi:MAG: holo-ACP synthase [Oscillospiraceae bacterium]|nr:holo-ACP synthase [Oscillospiraceae bacterium]MBR0452123.1 holo-ACP synthase [Oscillospiraceae bacterium]